MNDFLHHDITITRSEDAHVELKEKLIIGDLNKLACGSIDKISDSLINIFNALGAKTQSQPFYDIDRSQVGRKITVSANTIIDVENITNSFLLNIQSSNQSAQLLFDQISNSDEQIVRNETRKFLSQNGNRQIKEGLQVTAGGASISLAGRYGQNKIEILENEPPETYLAIVDGVLQHNRFVCLEVDTNKFINAYFDQSNLIKLRELFHSKQRNIFITQDKYDAMGRKDKYLIYIEDTDISFNHLEEI